jgi:outer membrane protein
MGLAVFPVLVPGHAEAKPLSIAVVDPVEALSQTDQAKAMMEKFKKEMSADTQEALRLEDEIKELIEKGQKDSAIMSAAQVENLGKAAEDKKMEYSFLRKKLQKKQQEGRDEILKTLGPKFEAVMNDIIKKGKYDLILHKQAIFHSASSIDITKTVTEKLNQMK